MTIHACREVLDPHCAPEQFAMGISAFESAGPNLTATFFVNRRDTDGETLSAVVCRVVMSREDWRRMLHEALAALDAPAAEGRNLLRVATHDAPVMMA